MYQMALRGQTSGALQIPISWIYASVPVGLSRMSISTLFRLKNINIGRKEVSDKRVDKTESVWGG